MRIILPPVNLCYLSSLLHIIQSPSTLCTVVVQNLSESRNPFEMNRHTRPDKKDYYFSIFYEKNANLCNAIVKLLIRYGYLFYNKGSSTPTCKIHLSHLLIAYA